MPALFEVKKLTKTFQDNGSLIRAVDDVSFSVESGEVVGLLGLNGAGKTTTLKMITGLVVPDKGELFFEGISLDNTDLIKYKQNVYVLLEGNRNLWWKLTVNENIKFISNMLWQNYDSIKEIADYYLRQLNLYTKKDSLVSDLSRGMQQKLNIILAILSPSKLVLMDEPTLGMDVESRQEAIGFIKEAIAKYNNKAFVVTSHDLDFIGKIANKVMIMKNGKIVANAPMDQLAPMFVYGDYCMKIESNQNFLEQLTKLRQRFNLNRIKQEANIIEFDFFMKSGIVFYELVEELKQLGVKVISFGQQTPDFEEMFLHIVRGKTS